MLLGAGAQAGVFVALLGALLLGMTGYFEFGLLEKRLGALQVVGYLPFILAGNTFGAGFAPCPPMSLPTFASVL